MRWRISGYALSATESVIDRWVNDATDQASAKFDQRLRFLRDRPSSQWNSDYAHHLNGADGIFEIRIEANKVAHRPMCMFGPNGQQFTVLNFAIEHNDKLRPPGALETAKHRKREVEAGKAEIIDYDEDD